MSWYVKMEEIIFMKKSFAVFIAINIKFDLLSSLTSYDIILELRLPYLWHPIKKKYGILLKLKYLIYIIWIKYKIIRKLLKNLIWKSTTKHCFDLFIAFHVVFPKLLDKFYKIIAITKMLTRVDFSNCHSENCSSSFSLIFS